MCFEPGSLRLTPEGYAAAREVGADMARGEAFSHHVELRAPKDSWRTSEAQLELMRAGVSVNRIKSIADETVGDCLPVKTVEADRPYVALWHYWGLYFDDGSDDVSISANAASDTLSSGIGQAKLGSASMAIPTPPAALTTTWLSVAGEVRAWRES